MEKEGNVLKAGYKVANYKLEELLGAGKFGMMFKAKDILGEIFAIKVMNKLSNRVVQEIHNLSMLEDCKNIIQMYGGYIEQDGYIFLVLEYCNGGTLHNSVSKITLECKYMEYNQLRTVSFDIARGLKEMHSLGIAHRDISLQNILIHKENIGRPKYKIANLSSSKRIGVAKRCIHDIHHHIKDYSTSLCGSHRYMAPEVFLNKPYDHSADIWSFGVLLYILAFGAYPFSYDYYQQEVLLGICYIPNTRDVSMEFVHLLIACLQFDSRLRIGIDDLCDHPFYRAKIKTRNVLMEFDIMGDG